jgi:hypothetical protein
MLGSFFIVGLAYRALFNIILQSDDLGFNRLFV